MLFSESTDKGPCTGRFIESITINIITFRVTETATGTRGQISEASSEASYAVTGETPEGDCHIPGKIRQIHRHKGLCTGRFVLCVNTFIAVSLKLNVFLEKADRSIGTKDFVQEDLSLLANPFNALRVKLAVSWRNQANPRIQRIVTSFK